MNKEKLKKELVEISELEDNWDGYGAEAFTKEIIDKVNEIIDCLDGRYPNPCIVPSPIGIQFEWDLGGDKNALEISVEDQGISSLQIIGNDIDDWIDKDIYGYCEIDELLEWLYGDGNG